MLVSTCGILVVDIIAAGLPSIASPGQLLYAPRGVQVSIGGHPANVSIDLVKLGLAKGEVSLTGPVGSDLFRDFIAKILEENGVLTHLQVVENVGTSKNMILVVEGEDRRFHVDMGANIYLNPSLVKNILSLEKPFLFYVGAAGMLGEFDNNLAEILEEAKGLKCITFVDIITPYKKGWDFLLNAFKHMDLFHCNLDEARSISRREGLREAADMLIGSGVKVALVTMGSEGGYMMSKGLELKLPAFKVNVVDPTGAGDAFCAGVILKLIERCGLRGLGLRGLDDLKVEDWIEILSFGSAAGAVCCMAEGTTTAVTRWNVEKLLKEQGDIFRGRIEVEII